MHLEATEFNAHPRVEGLMVSIIGAGLMGHSIAGVFAAAGARVTLFDLDQTALAAAPPKIERQLNQLGHDVDSLGNIRLSTDLADAVGDSRLVVEAIREDLAAKRALVRQIGEIAPAAVVATNTSALKIDEVARDAIDRSLILGAHWWNPPHLIPVVEIVHGKDSSPAAAVWLEYILADAGKTPVQVRKDIPGFIGNRLQHAMWREAIALVDAGVCDAETVDTVVRGSFGLRLAVMGPVENADYVGLDLTMAIHDYLFPSLSRDETSTDSIMRMVAEGKLGRKTGHGFMDWDEGRGLEAAGRLEDHLLNLLHKNESKHNAN